MKQDRTYLFLSVGQRDLQCIFTRISSTFRHTMPYEYLKDASSYPLVSSEGIREERFSREKDTIKSICFPMFDKTLSYLTEKDIEKIDCLFLLCTNRNNYLEKLNQLSEALSEDEVKLDLADYTSKLLDYAKKDKTSQTAELLKSIIEDNKLKHHNIDISRVEIIETGTYGFIEPIKKLSVSESRDILKETLFRVDINTLDFFEYELNKALKPFLQEIDGNRVYLSTYSGGMPILQRALDVVLDSTLINYQASPIFHSENLSFQSPSEPIHFYLKRLKSMTHCVLSLDWESAKNQFNSIKGNKDFHRYYDKQIIKQMEAVFDEAAKLNTDDRDAKRFDRFTTLLLRALYQRNINDALVWLKCLEEAAFNKCLQKEKKLWQSVGFNPNTRQNSVYTKNEQNPITAFPDILLKHFDKDGLSNTFKGYESIFLNPNDFTRKKDWDIINTYRNDLIHKGKSAAKHEESILKFIKINPTEMQKAIQRLANHDLDALIQLESNLWNNDFFKPLRTICQSKDKAYILPLRKLTKKYAELVLKL